MGPLQLTGFYQWPHFDKACLRLWHLRSHRESVVQVSGVDEEDGDQLLIRVDKRAIGDAHLAILRLVR